MTTIKPPGGKPPIDSQVPAPASGAPEAPGSGGFSEALEGAERAARADTAAAAQAAARPSGAAGTSAAPGADPIADLARALDAGELDPAEALERLLEHATSGVGRQLSSPERAELAAVLRSALQTDPSLGELTARLGEKGELGS